MLTWPGKSMKLTEVRMEQGFGRADFFILIWISAQKNAPRLKGKMRQIGFMMSLGFIKDSARLRQVVTGNYAKFMFKGFGL